MHLWDFLHRVAHQLLILDDILLLCMARNDFAKETNASLALEVMNWLSDQNGYMAVVKESVMSICCRNVTDYVSH